MQEENRGMLSKLGCEYLPWTIVVIGIGMVSFATFLGDMLLG
uniref:Uncharacterized protein n=1 Tax=Magnetococcus massalia (strain MO-1) TaxID=451514 RepID=A0A1S7LNJ5_MAGMO|nr:Protein of unknown function [Candidatus Magnetococcus massalia]